MRYGISALIFSIDEYELISKQIRVIYPYVDEIVIIDSSIKENQKKLMKDLEKSYRKVRVVWLPPIGIADFYYKVGINECKYDWILFLDSDELPNLFLLKNLRKLSKGKYDAYKIFRQEDIQTFIYMFMFFKKSVAYPTGLTFVRFSVLTENVCRLPKRYKIVHTRSDFSLSLSEKLKRSTKYFTIEKLVIGFRMLCYTDSKINFWFRDEFRLTSNRYIKLSEKLRNFILKKFGKIGFFYLLILFILLQEMIRAVLLGYKKLINPKWLRNSLSLIVSILPNFNKYYIIWLKFYNNGFYESLDLVKSEKIIELSKKIGFGNNGFENFKKLVNHKFGFLNYS